MHVRSTIMRGARVIFAVSIVGSFSSAAFADAKTECISAADQGQSARDDGRYRTARDSFTTCARSVCPKPVAASCTKWSREIDEAMPTVVLSAKDASGGDVSQARVTFDGKELTTTLDGKPVEVDPGAHKLHFEREGSDPIDQNVVIKAGEKLRAINVTFHATQTETVVVQPKVESKGIGNGAKIATTVVLGVLAVGGFVTGVSFGVASQGDAGNAQTIRNTMPSNACAGAASSSVPCQNLSSAVDAQNRDAAISVAMYIASGVLAAGAVVAWIVWPKPAKSDAAEKPAFSFLVGPAFAGVRGTF